MEGGAMKRELTARQAQVLQFIIGRRESGEPPPTLEEIRLRFGWSAIGTVQDHLAALGRKGYIRRRRGARRLEVLREGEVDLPGAGPAPETERVPVIGEVAAGTPVLAVENTEDEWYLDRRLLRGESNFLLRVRGESMLGAQIRDGDYVLVRPQVQAESGEIVVARIGDEVTVKRLYRQKGGIELRPQNSGFESMFFKKEEEGGMEIVGKVVGVMRRY